MDQVKVLYNRKGSTLTVWFGNPRDENTCEETGDGVTLMKDEKGRVIGFEKLYFSIPAHEQLEVAFKSIG